ncbi:MAG: recombination protein RecR [Gammaproteobacteria bacterium]|nr:recombination protein RecR [Gammaproteobacteria bacterium]|tara:strand:- start:306 stop:905 length:600 start_codon:yes stop_codon:yes gene_type:complete
MGLTPLVDKLIEAFQILPGVGPKSAQRMVLHLLQRDRDGAARLAAVMQDALANIGWCDACRNLAEGDVCGLCEDARREDELLCVVESPADIVAIEQAGGYRGRYFVLHGRLSPIDGIGPEELGMERLLQRARELGPREVIVATNPTVEGEATAHYVAQLLEPHVALVTRIAHGVPIGGELEYTDGGTIVHALQGRRSIN